MNHISTWILSWKLLFPLWNHLWLNIQFFQQFAVHPACVKNIELIWYQASVATKVSASIKSKSRLFHNAL